MLTYALPILIIVLSVIVAITLIVVFFGFNMIYINLRTLVPWVKTPLANMERALAEIDLPTGSLVYDLGCGDGRFLFLAEKKGFRMVGYELSLYPYLKAVLAKLLRGSSVMVENKDFLKQDLKSADAIFVFLTDAAMEKVSAKLRHDLKAGVMVISYGFPIIGWQASKILDTKPSKTYIYINAWSPDIS